MPRLFDAVRRLVPAHLRVDALGRAPQGELTQRDEVSLTEKALDGARGLLGDVDLAGVEPLEELVHGQVDDADLVGLVEDGVGHRLAHAHPGDLRDHVVQALEVLHVERGEDVDARVEQLLHVLPPLHVARSRRVRVGELVDEEQLGLSRERSVEVELVQLDAAVLHLAPREQLQAHEQRPRVVPSVRLHDPDDDGALLVVDLAARGLEHRVGLADAWRGAEEDRQLAPRRLLLLLANAREELVGVGAAVGHRGAVSLALNRTCDSARVERHVQCQHVHPRLTEHPELTIRRVGSHQRVHGALIHAASTRHPADLVPGGGR